MNLDHMQNHKVQSILAFSIPSIIAMVLTAMITVTDGYFAGNAVGKEGLAAMNLGLPIIYLYLAVGLMVSVGGMAIAGIALGGKDIKTCNSVFNQTIITSAVVTTLLSVLLWFCLNPILAALHVDRSIAAYMKDYYQIMLLQLPVMVINASLGMFIRGDGNPRFFMKINVLNVVLNVVFDYLFVRCVPWGLKGIAAASLLAALICLFCNLFYFLKQSQVYHFQRFSYSAPLLFDMLINGSSEFVGEMSLSISLFAYQVVILKHIGVDGITAFTIVGYLSYLFSMVVIGFGQGASPLISFVFGAGEKILAAKLRTITNRLVFGVGVLVFGLVVIGSGWYSRLFVKHEAVEQMVRSGAIIFSASFLVSGVNVITSFYFTSICKAKESALISFSRGLVLLLICIYTLPLCWGMTGVWLVAPVTELLTLVLSCFFVYQENRSAH